MLPFLLGKLGLNLDFQLYCRVCFRRLAKAISLKLIYLLFVGGLLGLSVKFVGIMHSIRPLL